MYGLISGYKPEDGFDLDGTIISFDAGCGETRQNHDLLASLQGRGVTCVAVCTNQGGLGFGEKGIVRRDGMPYPTVHQFLLRVEFAWSSLKAYGIQLADLRVSLYHPRLRQHEIDGVYVRLLQAQRGMPGMDVHLYRNFGSRKPQPQMLLEAGTAGVGITGVFPKATGTVKRFYGDSDDDEGAARAAGIEFIRVPRFV